MMSRKRRDARHYARIYLAVERLPGGVPAALDDMLARSTAPIPPEAFWHLLKPYRKPMWVL